MYVMTIDQRGSTGDVDRVPGLLEDLGGLATSGRFERSVGDEVQGVVQHPAEVVEIALHVLRSGHWYVGIGVGDVDRPLPASPREGSGPAFVAARAAVDRAKGAAAHVPLAVVAGRGGRAGAAPDAAATEGEAAAGGRSGTGGASATAGANRPDAANGTGGANGSDGANGPDGSAACANAEAVLRLVGRLVQDRTAAQWKVVDELRSVRHGQPSVHGTQKIAARNLGITEQSVSRAVLRSGWQEEWAARPAAEMLLTIADRWLRGADDGGTQRRQPVGPAARTPAARTPQARTPQARTPQARTRTTEGDT